MNDEIFLKPERPFLLISEDTEHNVSYSWLETEEELIEVVEEIKTAQGKIIDAIEIGSSRDIDIEDNTYLSCDFVEAVCSAYEVACDLNLDSIVLAIDTDCDKTYYISDTEDGFQCDSFDYYFEDLDSAAEELFNELHGKVTDIRIE